jgi:ribosome modulation factor
MDPLKPGFIHPQGQFQKNLMESGRLAFEAGIPKKNCALAMGSMSRKWWLQGWNKAAKDKQ